MGIIDELDLGSCCGGSFGSDSPTDLTNEGAVKALLTTLKAENESSSDPMLQAKGGSLGSRLQDWTSHGSEEDNGDRLSRVKARRIKDGSKNISSEKALATPVPRGQLWE